MRVQRYSVAVVVRVWQRAAGKSDDSDRAVSAGGSRSLRGPEGSAWSLEWYHGRPGAQADPARLSRDARSRPWTRRIGETTRVIVRSAAATHSGASSEAARLADNLFLRAPSTSSIRASLATAGLTARRRCCGASVSRPVPSTSSVPGSARWSAGAQAARLALGIRWVAGKAGNCSGVEQERGTSLVVVV